jgi:hypothetical protein
MLRILLFLSGCCLKTEVFKQLYFPKDAAESPVWFFAEFFSKADPVLRQGEGAFMRMFRPWGGIFCLCLLACFAVPGLEAQSRLAVLDRGHGWVKGIPGIENPALTALYGEYRLEIPPGTAAPEEAGEGTGGRRCRVWLIGEALPFAGEGWQPRTRVSGIALWQRQESEALLAGFSFSGGTGLGSWTAVFQFPRGLTTAGLDDLGANALIDRWLNRFRYFLALIKSPADISFPAVFAF